MSNHDTRGDHWTKDTAFFIYLGEKYGVIPDGQTVSLGPVSGAGQRPPDAQKPVAKIPTKGIVPLTPPQPIMQHRGRPRKEGQVHRTTKWRREKAEQGVLL